MAHPYADFEVIPELAKNTNTMSLEEYIQHVVEATEYWQESKCMVKNEIREIFSSINSIIHQREMQLYQEVDALVNRINYHNGAVDTFRSNYSEPVKNSASSDINKIFSCRSAYISPPLKLKFQANFKCLEDAIHSFGCAEIEDERVSDDSNFVIVDSAGDDLNMKANPVSSHPNDLNQNDIQNKIEVSTVVSSNSSDDSFEIVSYNKASDPSPRNDSNDAKLTCTGSLNGQSTVEVGEAGGPSGQLPHSSALSEELHDQWLRKSVSPTPEFSSAAALPKYLPFVLACSDSSTTPSKQAPSSPGCYLNDTNSVIRDLNNYLELAIISPIQSSTTGNADTAESRVQNSSACVSSSGSVPEFSSVIKKMLGNRNVSWLNRGGSGISWPLSDHNDSKVTTELMRQKNRLWLGRTVFRREGSLLVHVNSVEESHCPASSIKKMFNPYFETQDKNKWLMKNH